MRSGYPPTEVGGKRGAMLLEVILAMTILFMGMAVIGTQLQSAIGIAYENERATQALMLAEAKLAQLDSGAINLQRELGADGIIEGDFGRSFPGYFYRFTFEPLDEMENMYSVRTEILYGPPQSDREPGEIRAAATMVTLHTLRPTPPTLNLQRDFGFTQEQMDEMAASLPPEMDPTELSPAAFAEMDMETLLALLPQLLEMFGQGAFSSEQMQQAIDSGLLDMDSLPTGADAGKKDPGRSSGQGRKP